jgi:hypothetical protein
MGSCLSGGGQAQPATEAAGHHAGKERAPAFENTGLLSASMRSASYSVGRDEGNAGRQASGFEPPPQFQYLDRNYSLETPSCLVPQVNELFKSICERYDIAVTNREKVDEALQLFKKVLEVDPTLPIVECFTAWKSQLTQPKFSIVWDSGSGYVKKISVRAEEVPRLKRKAQKHIHDLLDACHLFLQQRDFLKREMESGLNQLDLITRDIPALCKGLNLSSSERKHMPQVIKRARDQFVQFPGTLDRFYDQVFALVQEISAAVNVLEDEAE